MSQAGEFFKLGDQGQGLHRELAPGVNAQIFLGDQAMLSVVRLESNAEGTLHHHPEEQWGMLLEGSGIRTHEGVEHAVEKGDSPVRTYAGLM